MDAAWQARRGDASAAWPEGGGVPLSSEEARRGAGATLGTPPVPQPRTTPENPVDLSRLRIQRGSEDRGRVRGFNPMWLVVLLALG